MRIPHERAKFWIDRLRPCSSLIMRFGTLKPAHWSQVLMQYFGIFSCRFAVGHVMSNGRKIKLTLHNSPGDVRAASCNRHYTTGSVQKKFVATSSICITQPSIASEHLPLGTIDQPKFRLHRSSHKFIIFQRTPHPLLLKVASPSHHHQHTLRALHERHDPTVNTTKYAT